MNAPSARSNEEDYDGATPNSVAMLLHSEEGREKPALFSVSSENLTVSNTKSDMATWNDMSWEKSKPDKAADDGDDGLYSIVINDKELRDIFRRGLERAKESRASSKGKRRFSDYVFARKFSPFDRQNEAVANSPFHGFFTLFWIGVSLLLLKIGAENWKNTGSPLGTNEIMRYMFKRDVLVLLMSDGVMCALTGVTWLLQLIVYKGLLGWDSSGWIVQSIWQATFFGANVWWTQLRQWPWSHTVFLVLHTLVMLMKQHSYAFYNGYLSTAYKRRTELCKKFEQVSQPVDAVKATVSSISTSTGHLARPPSRQETRQRRQSVHSGIEILKGSEAFDKDLQTIEAAIRSNEPLDLDQMHVFKQMIRWEVDALSEETRGKSTSASRAYPNNLSCKNFYEYIVFPTLVYELEYPRSESINWAYVGEKAAAIIGVIFVMIMVSQAFIYPVVMKTVAMRESGMWLGERFKEFPWLLADLMFPFMMEYLLTWYLIWEAILNLLGEVTCFADREFYNDWWNSGSWDQFARDWNRPVHNFLLRHVYHSSISAMKVEKHTAIWMTFFLSACAHELVMWCIFKKLRGYMLFLQMLQLPLVQLSKTKWLKGRQTLGNVIVWTSLFTGPSILCSLYLIL